MSSITPVSVPIPQLPAAPLPLTGTELVPMSKNGTTYEAATSAIAALSAGAVSSVFGRSGTVVAQFGDYSFVQISGTLGPAQMPNLTGDVTSVAAVTTVAKIQATVVAGTTGSGNVAFSASPTFTGTIAGAAISASGVVTSTVTTGTAPFTIASTTRVANLNVATAGTADTVTTNANLTGPITSVGNATSIASQTGTGTTFAMSASPTIVTPTISGHFTAEGVTSTGATGTGNLVFSASPTFVTPALGTPASGVATNLTGTAAGLTAGTVTTNANLTGVITSVGNATSIASQTGTGTKFVVDTSPTIVTPTLSGHFTAEGVTTTGATGTGNLVFSAAPTFTGHVTVPTPTNGTDAVTKAYADAISAGLDIKNSCFAGTTATLTATYLNLGGIGDTLTNASTLAAFSVDGQSPALNARILVKNQTSSPQNGIWVLTTIGSGIVAWVLTRATDYNQAAEIAPGDLVPVEFGTVNANTTWLETATVVTVGSDNITFTQFSALLTTPISVANGGTGLTSGTSGGVPTYTASGTLTSSGALTANNPVIGGGAGAVVAVGARSGNTTTFATTSGTLTNTHLAAFDASGNIVDGGAAGSGSLVQIGPTQTASGSATIDFTGVFSSTYNTYVVDINGVIPASGSRLLLEVGEGGGPTWQTGASYAYQVLTTNVGTTTSANSGGSTSIPLTGTTTSVSTAATGSLCLRIWFNNPSSAALYKTISWAGTFLDGSNVVTLVSGSAAWEGDTNALTGLRFLANSGNITSGFFSLYGVAK